ncbi:TetR/AcrR family transcriptional regulator [Rhizorhabdus dicambivorans]|uniref:TetR/AcrR family transcriptional regulator n=2 Tax=Rhizorhabdus dicambivorans TaxID=1850238 RepID=A0A2A4FV77_9SPHN|nr:TetR/AcrR family transcriptional regulator [Rhizorhabdus dicambivorans]ATE67191.1 TetR/AcrR family transcriptional regulator [Rhizorhabdus dicambivorans]PCE42681.1 TetR/AcrR family transcriptional regulator [Rhizorhabdus dicambivorans]
MIAAADNSRRREIGIARREKTREKLRQAAARVIAELGEQRATIDDFIAAAGVARGTFYNYYKTRQALLDDLWDSTGRDPFQAIQTACAKLADPAERLVAEARLVLREAAEKPAWGWLIYALSVDSLTVNADLLAYPRPDLEMGRRLNRFDYLSLSAATDMVVGTVRSALRATLAAPQRIDYAESIGILLLKALGIGNDEAVELCRRPLPPLNP